MMGSSIVFERIPTECEILESARTIGASLVERQAETEERRFYGPDTHEAFRAAGFYRMLTPKRYGGWRSRVPGREGPAEPLYRQLADLSVLTEVLNEMKVALVRLQLRRGHILKGDRIVGGYGNDGVATEIVMGCCQKCGDICKDGFADLNGVRGRCEVSNGGLTEIGCEDERILTCG